MRVLLKHPERKNIFVCCATLVTYIVNEKKLYIKSDGYVFKVFMNLLLYDRTMRALLKEGFVDLSHSVCEIIQE